MMKNILFIIFTISLFQCSSPKVELVKEKIPTDAEVIKETIQFPSLDQLSITADLYQKEENTKFMLLCHQAGYSRGEYIHTAPKLVDMGFNILAIDQRSGNKVNDVINETKKNAVKHEKATDFLDAKQDILAAIDYTFKLNGEQPIYLVGSSYSAALVLLIAKENPKVKAVAAFSPGEYLKGVEVTPALSGYTKNVFVTSSKKETSNVEALVSQIDAKYLSHFKSEAKGIHGSRALWETTDGHLAYWEAFIQFLRK